MIVFEILASLTIFVGIIVIINSLDNAHLPVWQDGESGRQLFLGPAYSWWWSLLRATFERMANWCRQLRAPLQTTTLNGFVVILLYFLWLVLAVVLFSGLIIDILFFLAVIACCSVLTLTFIPLIRLVDAICMGLYHISSHCPECHSRMLVPDFICPECGTANAHLLPGIHGIFHAHCHGCGAILASSWISGRGHLHAICSKCQAGLVHADARQVCFQLVGAANAGKTVFLSSFFHRFLHENRIDRFVYEVPADMQPYFDDLEEYYHSGYCPATAQRNSRMYSIIINSIGNYVFHPVRQFYLYDIAGEMFDGVTAGYEIPQQQFDYIDGFILVLDPFSYGTLRNNRMRKNGDMTSFSNMPAEQVVNNFIEYIHRIGNVSSGTKCNKPLSVLIAKSDEPEVYETLGRYMDGNPGFVECDRACRAFLQHIGHVNAVNNLDAEFNRIHYFPISALGHQANGAMFNPQNIMRGVIWLIRQADSDLANRLIL